MAWTVLRDSGRYTGYYRNANGTALSAGTFDQEKQALKAAIKMEDEQREPGAVDPRDGRILWRDWWELWSDSRALAYSTEQNYRSTADLHIIPFWGDTKLCDIRQLEVSAWVKRLQRPKKTGEKARSAWTVRSALMLFKTSLNAAASARRIKYNPAKEVPYPDLPDGLERYLTPDEVEAIAFELDGPNSLILWTAVQTGMRFGELAGLHWPRVNLDRRTIDIVEAYDQAAKVVNPLPKDDEKRTVPIPDDLAMLLTRYRERRPKADACGLVHAGGRCLGDLVFRGGRGAVLTSKEWGRGPFKKAKELAGVEGRVRVHDLRHTYASWLIQEGVSLAELGKRLGHSKAETTQKYAHLRDDGGDVVREALTSHRIAGRIADSGFAALREAIAAEAETLDVPAETA